MKAGPLQIFRIYPAEPQGRENNYIYADPSLHFGLSVVSSPLDSSYYELVSMPRRLVLPPQHLPGRLIVKNFTPCQRHKSRTRLRVGDCSWLQHAALRSVPPSKL
jgi:hypothetical protein